MAVLSYFRLTSLIPPLFLQLRLREPGGDAGGGCGAKWLTEELPFFFGPYSPKTLPAILAAAQASLYDLWSLGPGVANPT